MFLIFLTRIARLFSHMLKRLFVDIFFHYREWKYPFNQYLCDIARICGGCLGMR